MTEHQFDPEVVALLEEIAADPESSMLRLPKRPLRHWIAGPEEVVTPHASYLTKAERHLAQAYREEAAMVLLEACVGELKNTRLTFSSIESSPSLSARARNLIRSRSVPGAERQLIEQVSNLERSTSVLLAGSAMRLAPCDFGRSCLGVSLIYCNQEGSARHVLESVVTSGATSRQKARALANLGLSCSQVGDYASALEYNRAALEMDEGWIGSLVWALVAALQLGNVSRAAEFVDRVEQHPEVGELPGLAKGMKRDKDNGFWKPSPASIRALQVAHRGAHTKELCHAFE